MSLVVFLRAANVGGHQTFRPSELARRMADLRVASIGAAGTFVVGADVTEREARDAFLHHLPFDTPLMICRAEDLVRLVKAAPFDGKRISGGEKVFVSVLERRPARLPKLPIRAPEGDRWQVSAIAAHGRFVVTLHRRTGGSLLYPNEVVERSLGIPATTRGWPTILKVHQALQKA